MRTMASKRRLRRHTCGRKQRYPTQTAACAAIRIQRHKWVQHMTPYHCPWCHGWHIGRTPQRVIAQIQQR